MESGFLFHPDWMLPISLLPSPHTRVRASRSFSEMDGYDPCDVTMSHVSVLYILLPCKISLKASNRWKATPSKSQLTLRVHLSPRSNPVSLRLEIPLSCLSPTPK